MRVLFENVLESELELRFSGVLELEVMVELAIVLLEL